MKDRRMYFALFDKCFKFDKFGCYNLRDTTKKRNTSKKEKEESQDVPPHIEVIIVIKPINKSRFSFISKILGNVASHDSLDIATSSADSLIMIWQSENNICNFFQFCLVVADVV